MPLPELEPALQLCVLEPEVGVQTVGEDGVLGGCKPSSTALDLAGQELRGHLFKGGVDQVVDVRSSVTDEVAQVAQQLGSVQVVGVDQGQQKVGIEVAAVEQRINEAMCVHEWNGEVIKHALSSPSPLSLVVKVEPLNNLDRTGRRRYAYRAYCLTSTSHRLS